MVSTDMNIIIQMRTENEHTFWGWRINEQKWEKADEKRILAKSSLSPRHQKNPITTHSASQKVGAFYESLSERLTLYQEVTIQEFERFDRLVVRSRLVIQRVLWYLDSPIMFRSQNCKYDVYLHFDNHFRQTQTFV